ncbi:MAG: ABC transporter permease [Chloroflexota bacterium]
MADAVNPTTIVATDERPTNVEVSQFSLAWQRYRKSRGGMVAFIILLLLTLGIIFVPMLSPFDVHESNPLDSLFPAGKTAFLDSRVHIFGADYLGRDFFTRLFYAGRASLFVSLLAAFVAVVFGTLIGLVAGYYGKWVDTLLMRSTDFMLALPLLPMYIFGVRILVTTTDTRQLLVDTMGGVITTFIVFVLFGWMGVARLVRGSILTLRTLDYIEASRALGASSRRIIFKHLLPNAFAPVFVAATFLVADFIIWEAILAYFIQGIVDPPVPSWGNMLVGGIQYVTRLANLNPFEDIRSYLFLMPNVMIFVTVICINYIGDTMREALDPRSTRV